MPGDFVQRFERNFALREMSIFERLRKRKKTNTSDDQNHYKHSNRRTHELDVIQSLSRYSHEL